MKLMGNANALGAEEQDNVAVLNRIPNGCLHLFAELLMAIPVEEESSIAAEENTVRVERELETKLKC